MTSAVTTTTAERSRAPGSPAVAGSPVAEHPDAGRLRGAARRWRRPEDDPRWVRPAVISLLVATAVLYLWGLGASGWANSFYSAAAQAGSVSWKAFLFGSSDGANSITVDKTPLSLWPMALAVRVFGLSSWSILVPQALEGVAAVGVLYLAVKRWFGAAAGLLAGAILAVTPVAVLMFRFNNPDALLVLLTVASAYFLIRAIEDGRTRWMVAAGAMVGLGFLTKELQAFVILPVLVGTYLVAGPPRVLRRIVQSMWLGLSTLVAGGWWVAVVSVWPASSRPWFGGSQDNTFWNVLFGYNGLGRLTGNETGSVTPGGGQAGAGRWGATGVTRLFNAAFGGQASWLIPTALLVLVAGLIWTLRRPRTDRARAALLLWGGWLVLTGLVISLSQGIIHEYYTVALAPAIGALVGVGAVEAWRRRDHPVARNLMALGTAITAGWSFVLLSRTPAWTPWLRWAVLVVGLGAALTLLVGGRLVAPTARRWTVTAVAAVLLAVTFAGPTAYALNTAATPHTGSLPTAGPAGRTGGGGPGGAPNGAPGGFGARGGGPMTATPPAANGTGGTTGPSPAGGPSVQQYGTSRSGVGGLLQGSTPGTELTEALTQGSEDFEWVAATVGANSAAGYQLATGLPVMPIGGFNGSDPSPTLAQFQDYVADGRIHFYIAGGGGGTGGPGGGSGNGSEITQWVQQNFTAVTVDGVTLYDLTSPSA